MSALAIETDRDFTPAPVAAAFGVTSPMLGKGTRMMLHDPEERRLFASWARNVLAIYSVLIALAFMVLACSPNTQSSGAQTSNDTVQTTPPPPAIEPPQPLPPSL